MGDGMNKEKYREVVVEESRELENMGPIVDPESWRQAKPKIERFVREMDQLTEVYEMENQNGNS
jgi:hypothetical protein